MHVCGASDMQRGGRGGVKLQEVRVCAGRVDEGKLAGAEPMFESSCPGVRVLLLTGGASGQQCDLALFTHETALVLHLISALQGGLGC